MADPSTLTIPPGDPLIASHVNLVGGIMLALANLPQAKQAGSVTVGSLGVLRCLGFWTGANVTMSWAVDRDCMLRKVVGYQGACIWSLANNTFASYSTAPVFSTISTGFICQHNCTTVPEIAVNFPLKKHMTLYCIPTGTYTGQVLLEDV